VSDIPRAESLGGGGACEISLASEDCEKGVGDWARRRGRSDGRSVERTSGRRAETVCEMA
jgi:hypothetical protein